MVHAVQFKATTFIVISVMMNCLAEENYSDVRKLIISTWFYSRRIVAFCCYTFSLPWL